MENYGEKLAAHGARNGGEDLIDFQKDVDAALCAAGFLEYAHTRKTDDPDCMLVTKCKLKAGMERGAAKSEMEKTWLNKLRYLDHEEHMLEDTEEGFVFHYLTWTKFLGVAGRIECRK